MIRMKARSYHKIIRDLRESNELSQRELGEKVGLCQTAISQYELRSRNIILDNFEDIVDALGFRIVLVSKDEVVSARKKKSHNVALCDCGKKATRSVEVSHDLGSVNKRDKGKIKNTMLLCDDCYKIEMEEIR